ncbi:translocation/assembly module TamB domain-containing protein [Marinoscillum sp. 108]|uniref:translocation/assembly module TamB domain-containing protein n=1 Tax=Marinoscillum sp. 108 TaxID=2653151 RepID=UPI0012F0BA55|nr:translocation/assembly module TamB domain-containing protein [Marinoscillum sp. 108]VXD16426.1 conserved hypothetical protein [Marinoscillum sp. 108]
MKGKITFRSAVVLLRKLIFWSITGIAIFLVILILLLQTPFLQNYLANEVLSLINANTRQTAKFTNIKIKWFDFVEIKGLEVKDYQDNVMISASTIQVDYQLDHLLVEGDLWFDQIYLRDGALHMKKYEDTLNLNLIEFINDLRALAPKKQDTVSKASAPKLSLGKIRLDQFQFSYDNRLNDSLPQGKFDYGHFLLEIPGATFADFTIIRDTIQAEIRSLAARDPATGLTVEKLQTMFMLNSHEIDLSDLVLETRHSIIRDHFGLKYSDFSALSDFTNSVALDVNLVDARISKHDLAFFVDLPTDDFEVNISTQISGPVPRLSLSNLQLDFGIGTHLEGSFDFMGLPAIEETFIDARVKEALIYPQDVQVFTTASLKELEELGEISFSGRFLGFTNDFVANATFDTNEGKVYSDLNLKFPKGWEEASYSGKLKLDHFNVGKVIGDTMLVGRVNLEGKIDGQGLTQKNAKFYLDAEVFRSEIFGYEYEHIKANGQFSSQFFEGKLEITDPNCKVLTEGSVDLKQAPERVKIYSEIDTLDLFALGFTRTKWRINGRVDADLSGLNLDSLQGSVRIDDLGLVWSDDSLKLDSVKLNSSLIGRQRRIELILPELDVQLEGDFYFSQISSDIETMASELEAYFSPDYSRDPEKVSADQPVNSYSIDFQVRYHDISRYTNLIFDKDFYLSPKGVFEGTYYQRKNATLSIFAEIDSVYFNGFSFNQNTIDVNLSKDLDSAGIIASVFIDSQKQAWKDNPPTKNLSIEAVWFDDKINFYTSIAQPENNSSADINGEMKLSDDRLTFNFLPSKLVAFGERWYFNPYNKITLTEKELVFDRMELYQNDQSILLKGIYTDSAATNLNLSFKNFDLKALGALLPVSLGGVLDATVDLIREDIQSPFILDSDLNVNAFELNEFVVGNVAGRSKWNPGRRGLEIDFGVQREAINTITIAGMYIPGDSLEQLDIKAEFNQANLQLLDPFLQGLFSDIGGFADGEIAITGSTRYPVLNGSSSVSNGRFTFDYLGTTYSFDGDLSFDNKAINFNGIKLRDRDDDRATLSGAIYHRGFRELEVDINMAVRDFQLLNTTASENSLYYGTANATGDISIAGPVEDLIIKAKATTEKGTKLFIPLSESSEITQKDYISFVDFSDTTNTFNIDEIVKNSISGIRLDFEIDVTPDAYVELIFDIRTGDIIRGRGNGNLKMFLDTNGEFELFGDLSITEGAYNFTIPALGINKEFTVSAGSTISWYGDPYSGILNLNANYRQLASFDEFDGTADASAVSQKYPVLVVLKLQGEMLSPRIDFEIKLEDSQSSPTSDVQRALSVMNNNEQELKRQVFSLLILRKFYRQSSFNVGGSDVGGSLSEFLSNQFSYFISQVDENLEVDVDLSSLDANAFNTFQLRLSYTFMDGRLRVSGGGAIPSSGADDPSTNDVIGDWSIRYLLTPDGHFRVKAFSKTEQIANDLQRETGVSFQYIKSFDDLRELLTRTREAAISSKPKDMSKERAANEEG